MKARLVIIVMLLVAVVTDAKGQQQQDFASRFFSLHQDRYSLTCKTVSPAMMERVLHNLLGNASHHLGADGWFAVRCLPTAGGCRVEVQDHGPGIAADDLPRIFDRYYRSRSDSGKTGTGLGLSITKAILQSHGADFGVDSTLGHGATFWFVLSSPAAKPAAKLPAPGKGGAPS